MALNPSQQTRYLLLYSTSVAAIKVDGLALPQSQAEEILSGQPGWHVDSAQQRTLVCLPAGAARNIGVALSRHR